MREYMEPFTGGSREFSPREKEQVAKRFSTGVNALFDTFPHDIDKTSSLIDGRPHQSLFLVNYSDVSVDFQADRVFDEETNTYIRHALTIRLFEHPKKRATHELIYAFDPQKRAIIRINEKLGLEEGISFQDHEENILLENEMGFNSQPVRLEEVNNVLAEASEARPMVVSFGDLESHHSLQAFVPNSHEDIEEEKKSATNFRKFIDGFMTMNSDRVQWSAALRQEGMLWSAKERFVDYSDDSQNKDVTLYIQMNRGIDPSAYRIQIRNEKKVLIYQVLDDLLTSTLDEPSDSIVSNLALVNERGFKKLIRFINHRPIQK